ncbi:ABC transporter permease [Enterococcus sp. HY326]|uniref:ABC transporter permease n=1 Tax=Enterococcus sp. HY326 TaxID=2971265 RepID=UPI0022402E66|nr:ABC transporter permease [Enterococcus sp. HY326]
MIFDIWKKREHAFIKLLLKSIKFVLNDSLVSIILFVLIFMYSDLKDLVLSMRTINESLFLVIIAGLYTAFVMRQNFFTFIEEPDLIFLGPKEKEIIQVIRQSFFKQISISSVIEIPIYFLTYLALSIINIDHGLILLCNLIFVLKFFQWVKFNIPIYKITAKHTFSSSFFNIFVLVTFLLLTFKLYFFSYALLVCLIIIIKKEMLNKNTIQLNWKKLMENENQSWNKLHFLLGNFVKIKEKESNISQSILLEKLLDRIPKNKEYLMLYIYLRSFCRKSENRVNLFVVTISVFVVSVSLTNTLIGIIIPLVIHLLYSVSFFQESTRRVYPIMNRSKRQYLILGLGIWLFFFIFFAPSFLISLVFSSKLLLWMLPLSGGDLSFWLTSANTKMFQANLIYKITKYL